MSVTVFPIRVIMLLFCLLLMWITTSIAMYGVSHHQEKPMSGWRRKLSIVVRALIRGVLFSCGYHKIRIIDHTNVAAGDHQTKAAIVVAAPHTTFYDAVILFACDDFPTGVSRIENDNLPFLGAIVKFTQPVYVIREDQTSRQKTIAELKRRATSSSTWPEIVIFPEGTCSNGKCLIAFKPGAFIPGMPVRPVSIRHKNRMNTTYWTWDGPGAYTVMWLTLCQFSTEAVLERLPIYVPNADERSDPKLFASSVQKVIANALNVPVTDHSYEDCQLMLYAAKLGLPSASGLLEFQKLSRKLGVRYNQLKTLLEKFSTIARNGKGQITLEVFAKYLELPVTESLQQLFTLYDRNCSGTIDFREYIIGLCLVSQPPNTEDVIRLAFELFDHGSKGYITEPELAEILHNAFGMSHIDTRQLFAHVDSSGDGKISYAEFKAYAEQKPEYAKLFLTYRELMKSKENLTDTSNHNLEDKKTY